MLNLKPQLPFFTSEKRFKPPTAELSQIPPVSYFKPTITFKENPELFLNGLIKDVKKDLIPKNVLKTVEQATQKNLQTKLLIRPQEKEYDGTAQFLQLARQAMRFDLDYVSNLSAPRQGSRAPIRERPKTAPTSQPEIKKVEKSQSDIQAEQAESQKSQLIATQESKAVESVLTEAEQRQIIRTVYGENSKATTKRRDFINQLSQQGKTTQQITDFLKTMSKQSKAQEQTTQITATTGGVAQVKGGQALRALKVAEPSKTGFTPAPPPPKATGGAVLPPVKQTGSNIGKK
jgi:hypothetical protein